MLYHRDIFIPAGVKNALPIGRYNLLLSNHAKHASSSDRYGEITIPEFITIKLEDIFEVEVVGNRVTKFVVRSAYNAKHDICIVIVPTTPVEGRVKTVWLNKKSDNHKTLDKNKYCGA